MTRTFIIIIRREIHPELIFECYYDNKKNDQMKKQVVVEIKVNDLNGPRNCTTMDFKSGDIIVAVVDSIIILAICQVLVDCMVVVIIIVAR